MKIFKERDWSGSMSESQQGPAIRDVIGAKRY